MEIRVSQVMNREVATCRPFDRLLDAARDMLRGNLGCLPVVAADGSNRVIGMLTDRDVSMAATRDQSALDELQVRSAMAVSVLHCKPGHSVEEALAVMRSAGVHRLPVLDEDGTLVGLISLSDISLAFLREDEGVLESRWREVCRTLADSARRSEGEGLDEDPGRETAWTSTRS